MAEGGTAKIKVNPTQLQTDKIGRTHDPSQFQKESTHLLQFNLFCQFVGDGPPCNISTESTQVVRTPEVLPSGHFNRRFGAQEGPAPLLPGPDQLLGGHGIS